MIQSGQLPAKQCGIPMDQSAAGTTSKMILSIQDKGGVEQGGTAATTSTLSDKWYIAKVASGILFGDRR